MILKRFFSLLYEYKMLFAFDVFSCGMLIAADSISKAHKLTTKYMCIYAYMRHLIIECGCNRMETQTITAVRNKELNSIHNNNNNNTNTQSQY